MNIKMEEEKHDIALLVELVLYKRIKSFDDENIESKVREEKKQLAIETFIKECTSNSRTMSKEQISAHVQFILNRTIENIKQVGR